MTVIELINGEISKEFIDELPELANKYSKEGTVHVFYGVYRIGNGGSDITT